MWPALLATLGSFGVMQGATFLTARRQVPLGRLMATCVVLGLLQSAIFAAVGLVVVPLALEHYGSGAVNAGYLYLAFVPLGMLTLFMSGIVNGLHRLYWFQAVRLLPILVPALLLAAAALAGELTVTTAVVCYLIGTLVTGSLAAAVVAREGGGPRRFSRDIARPLLSFGLRSHTTTVSTFLNTRLDQLVIAAFLSPALLGVYVIAVTLTSVTTLVGFSTALIALPRLASLRSKTEQANAARVFVTTALATAAVITVPILIFEPALIRLFFGEEFSAAAEPGRILLVAAVVYAINRTLEAVLQGLGRPLDAGIGEGAAVVLTAAGLAVLLPTLELTGAAIASLLAYSASGALMVHRTARALGVRAREIVFPDRDALLRGLRLLGSARG